MKLKWMQEIVGEHYTEDLDAKVCAAIGERFVSKTDFNALNETKKTLAGQIAERDRQLEELKKVDAAGLQAEITRLQGENKIAAEKFKADLAAMKFDHALDNAILSAKGKNTKAIKALLQTDKLKLKDDGSIEGLDLDALKASDPYLFDSVNTKRQGGGDPAGDNADPKDFSKMTYSEMAAYAQTHPEAKFE